MSNRWGPVDRIRWWWFVHLLLLAPALGQEGLIELRSPTPALHDRFGAAVAMDGDRALVSSLGEDGVPYYIDVGAVHVYEVREGSWHNTASLRPSDPTHDALFGRSLALSGDLAVVGAPFASSQGGAGGAVYVFERGPTGWRETQKLTASRGRNGDRFGDSLALHNDRLVVGASEEDGAGADAGAVFVFEQQSSGWRETAILESPTPGIGARFGAALALEGATLVVSAPWHSDPLPGVGALWSFERAAAGWALAHQLHPAPAVAHGNFGRTLGLRDDTLVVGSSSSSELAPFEGSVAIYEHSPDGWLSRALLHGRREAYERFGTSVAIGDGVLAIGAPGASPSNRSHGDLWLFGRAGHGWMELGPMDPDEPPGVSGLGSSLAIESGALLAGAPTSSGTMGPEGAAVIRDLSALPKFETLCSGVGCPCGNNDPAGGCRNSTGHGARLSASGSASLLARDLRFHATHLPPRRFALLLSGSHSEPRVFGDGLLCLQGKEAIGPPGLTSRSGTYTVNAWDLAGLSPGVTRHFQVIHRELLGPCNQPLNTSQSLLLTFGP